MVALSEAFLGGRAYSALPCAGAPPPHRPRSCSRRSEVEANVTVSARGGLASPHPRLAPVGAGLVPAHLPPGEWTASNFSRHRLDALT